MPKAQPIERRVDVGSVFNNQVMQGVAYVALLVSAFFIGNLSAKVQYLEQGRVQADTTTGGTQVAPAAGKYKSFDEAMKALSSQAKLDGNKLVTCMNSGSKKSVVDAETAYGNTVGVQGTPAFFINGRFIGGAFPFEAFKEVIDKELDGTATDVLTDYSQTLQSAAAQGAFDPKPRDVDPGNGPIRGDKNAKITIVEFSDFQCPFCEKVFPTVEQVLKEYNGKIKLVYRHYPLVTIHPRAQIAAEAAECAKDQGKFWEFHDQLFAQQADWSSL